MSFKDDGPTAANATPGTAITITLDETTLSTDTKSFASYFSSAAYGTDGAGSVAYALKLSGEGIGSGLYALDTADISSTDGDGVGQGVEIKLYSNGSIIEGRTVSSSGTLYFTLTADTNAGTVTFTQSQNVWHPYTSDLPLDVALAPASNALQLVQTVTDADGDTSKAGLDLGAGKFAITAHPDAITVSGGSYNENSPRAVFTVNANLGQWLTLDVVDAATTDKAPTGDDEGKDAINGDALTSANIFYSIDGGATWTKYTAAFQSGTANVLVAVDISNEVDTVYEGEEQLKLVVNSGQTTVGSGYSSIFDDGTGDITAEITESTTGNTGTDDPTVPKDDDRPIEVVGGNFNENSGSVVFTVNANPDQWLTLNVVDEASGDKAATGDNEGKTDDSLDLAPIHYSIDGGKTWVLYTGPFQAGTLDVLVAVDVANEIDDVYEGEEQFKLIVNEGQATESSGYSSLFDDGTGIVTDLITDKTKDYTGTDNGRPKDDDRPIEVVGGNFNENSGSAVFTVNANPGQWLTLNVVDQASGAKAPTGDNEGKADDSLDLAPIHYSIDGGKTWVLYTGPFQAGTLDVLVAVDVANETDDVYEGEEQFKLIVNEGQATESSGYSSLFDDGTGTVTQPINDKTKDYAGTDNGEPKDDDRPIEVVGGNFNENSGSAVFTVNANPGQWLTLNVVDQASGAKAPTGDNEGKADDSLDLAPIHYSIDGGKTWVLYTGPFQAGTLDVLVAVDVANEIDDVYEGEEQFKLIVNEGQATESSGYASLFDDGTGTVTNQISDKTTDYAGADNGQPKDDDRPVRVNDIQVNEGSPFAIFQITGGENQLVSLTLADETAGPTDYGVALEVSTNGGQTWVPYTGGKVALSESGTMLVRTPVRQDTLYEVRETFVLQVTTTSNVTSAGTAAITDDGTGDIFNPDGTLNSSALKDDDRPVASTPPPVTPPAPASAPAPLAPPDSPIAPMPPFDSATLLPERSPLPLLQDRQDTFQDTLTSNAGFPVVVVEGTTPRLTVNSGVTDQFVEPSTLTRFALPFDAFAHTKSDAVISLQAKQADGSDLPAWVQFDAQSGTFQVNPPADFNGELKIMVIARDAEGREATAPFRFFVGQDKDKAKPQAQGRLSLSEQIKLAGKRPAALTDLLRNADGKPVAGKLVVEKSPAKVPAVREVATV